MYNDVKTFIEACDQEKTEDNQWLYANLIQEEFQEFIDALHESNLQYERLIRDDKCITM